MTSLGTFTDVQKETIRSLTGTGNTVDALCVILAIFEGRNGETEALPK